MANITPSRSAVIACAIATALTGTAAAQEGVPSQVGPGWTFTPAVSFGMTFDSNVSLSGAPASGHTPSDRLFVVEPAARLDFQTPRTTLSAGYQGRVRRYVTLSALNNVEQRADLSAKRLVSERLTIFFSNDFMRVPTTDDAELNGVPYSRTGTTTNRVSAGFTERLSEATDLSFGYDNTWVTFDQSAGANTFLSGGILNAVRGDITHRLSDRMSVGGSYAFRMANMNQGARDMLFHDVGSILHYSVGLTTTVSAAAGVSRLIDRTLNVTRTGPFFHVGLSHEMARATVGGAFDRALVPSFGFGGTSANEEVAAFIRMPFALNRFYVQGTGSWRRSEPLIESSVQLDTWRLRTSAGYAATRWLRAEALYAYSRQDSIVTGGEINRHRFGVQLVVSEPVRIH